MWDDNELVIADNVMSSNYSTDNWGDERGGGLCLSGIRSVIIDNNEFIGNSSPVFGGGYCLSRSSQILDKQGNVMFDDIANTFQNNSADQTSFE